MSPDSRLANLIIPLFGSSNNETILNHIKKTHRSFSYTFSKIIKLYYFFVLSILWKPKENQLLENWNYFYLLFFLFFVCGLFSACKHTWETIFSTYYFYLKILILFQSTLVLLLFIRIFLSLIFFLSVKRMSTIFVDYFSTFYFILYYVSFNMKSWWSLIY